MTNKYFFSSVLSLTALGIALFGTGRLEATIISVNNGGEIIAPPAFVLDATVTNDHQQGFDELQGVLLIGPLAVDSGFIPPGTVVDSHMIFLNSGGPPINHLDVQWTFDNVILGVMSDSDGVEETLSTPILGWPGTTYPVAPFALRGIEFDDTYSVLGNVFTLNSHVAQPGDWVRVVTAHSVSVPEPSTYAVLAGFLGAALVAAKRRRVTAKG